MRTKLIVLMLLLPMILHAKPMTSSVDSWEGTFKITPPYLAIQAEGLPELNLWLYKLDAGSKGTCVGFSRENGDMILAPTPNAKGVQPVYTGHFVLFDEAGHARIIVTYDVQGNGAMQSVEEYTYDGKQITLTSRSMFHGKHEPVWKKDKGEQAESTVPVKAAPSASSDVR